MLSTRQSKFLLAVVVLASALLGASPAWSSVWVVTSFAGSSRGYADGPALTAQFDFPSRLVLDSSHNLVVGEPRRVRRVSQSGVVSTLAGSGAAGFADGPGSSALFGSVSGLAADGSGNVYVSDGANHRIRKLDPTGFVTTLAGSDANSIVDGTGTAASFSSLTNMSMLPTGDLLVVDGLVLRRVTLGGVVTTLPGAPHFGAASDIRSIAVDAAGVVFAADANLNKILRVDLSVGSPSATTFAGTGGCCRVDGALGAATFFGPTSLAFGADGSLFVGEFGNNDIRRISNGLVSTVAGSGALDVIDGLGTSAAVGKPYGLVVDGSVLFEADAWNHRIRRIALVDPPTISQPQNIVAESVSPEGAQVGFALPMSSTGTVACVPPSNSLFPVGVTTVTCTAIDQYGQMASTSFTVTVGRYINLPTSPRHCRGTYWRNYTDTTGTPFSNHVACIAFVLYYAR